MNKDIIGFGICIDNTLSPFDLGKIYKLKKYPFDDAYVCVPESGNITGGWDIRRFKIFKNKLGMLLYL